MDCCPFPQAKGLLIDICRAFYAQLTNNPIIFESSSSSVISLPTLELKRAPINPQLLSSNQNIPIKPTNKTDTIETMKALKHIEEMKNLESYHLKLDEYCSQYFQSSKFTTISTTSTIFLDLFVFPPLRLISQDYESSTEVILDLFIFDLIIN